MPVRAARSMLNMFMAKATEGKVGFGYCCVVWIEEAPVDLR